MVTEETIEVQLSELIGGKIFRRRGYKKINLYSDKKISKGSNELVVSQVIHTYIHTYIYIYTHTRDQRNRSNGQ